MAKILIVDDSSFMRKVIAVLLDKLVNSIGEASDGNEALTKYAQLKSELVIMDITMNNVTDLKV